jgi:Flp pilus assembly protein TadG
MERSMKTRWHRQRGQSLLETAMMIVVIFLVSFWIFELGWLVYTYSVLADAANEGVRYSIVSSGGDANGTKTIVRDVAGTSLPNTACPPLCTTVTFPNGAAPPNTVQVTVTYKYAPVFSNYLTAFIMQAEAQGGRVVP